MRAAVVTAHGDSPQVRSVPAPTPGADEVLVEVTAASVTPLDILCASGTSYFGPPALPYVPGVQGVGVVRQGPTGWTGRRVWFPTSAGMARGDGSFAEYAVAPLGDLVTIEGAVGDAEVAALGLSAVAAWEVLEGRAQVRPGEQVLVLGAGGIVGQVAVQAARVLGARRVVAAARSERAQDAARAAGADAVVALEDGRSVDDLRDALGRACDGAVDVVVDPIAGAAAQASLGLLATGGRLVNLGSSASPGFEVDSATLRSRSAAVLGYTNAALTPQRRAEVLRIVIGHAAAGRLRVRHTELPLEQVEQGWRSTAEGSATGRVVLRPAEGSTR